MRIAAFLCCSRTRTDLNRYCERLLMLLWKYHGLMLALGRSGVSASDREMTLGTMMIPSDAQGL